MLGLSFSYYHTIFQLIIYETDRIVAIFMLTEVILVVVAILDCVHS